MKRRTLLGLIGSSIGGTAAVGSGAFSTTQVDRKITVEVVNDTEAYLRLEPLQTTKDNNPLSRSYRDGDQIRFRIPGADEQINDLTQGSGLAPNSEYFFDNLVEIGNQGSDSITVYTESTGEINKIAIYDSDDTDKTLLTDRKSGYHLSTGGKFEAGIYINTYNVGTGTKEEKLRFIGSATDV